MRRWLRMRLRWRILLFTALPIATLTLASLWIVNRIVSRQAHEHLQLELQGAAAVFEDLMATRARELETAGQVIVQDPKFFSVLTLPGAADDPSVLATVRGVARDFYALVPTDLFEVLDAHGAMLASVAHDGTSDSGRAALVREALAGRTVAGILVEPAAHYQAVVMPVTAGGRTVGALLLGAGIGPELASHLRELTRSEVTFVSGSSLTGSTLAAPEDRRAALTALTGAGSDMRIGVVLEVRSPAHVYLTLARALPGAAPGRAQAYVLQRALDVETAHVRDMQGGLMLLGAFALVVALAAGFLVAERITAPVHRLVRGAEEMERGNYDYPIEVRNRDEIGYLAERFRYMRQQQRAYVNSLEEVARLKTEFISVASHELRTPISIIAGFQQLMADGAMGPVTEDQREALVAIDRSVVTLTRIAENATRIAQVQGERVPLSRATHELAPLLHEAATTVRSEAPGRAVRITVLPAVGLPPARVDATRLVQALVQLVRNGVRFTPDGGEVQLRARRTGDVIEIAVADDGIGIPPEQQQHVFERAALMRDSRHHHSSTALEFNSAGLGLGLGIARGIVEAHGGTLKFDSAQGHGTTFTLRLPLDDEEALAQAA